MSTDVAAKPDMVTFTIDGTEVEVPKGTLVIRAAEKIGLEIPRFCDHPLLDPVAACRACLVEVPDAGNGRPMKPQPACALTAMPGMRIETAESNDKVAKHQKGMIEFLLINHPLDCPICDKGGECPLQNQTMSHGPGESRYEGAKRTYVKPIHISAELLLDRDRCVLCQRCSRFSSQISGDDFISLAERGAMSQISIYEDQPYTSYFAGNIVQICPVGALTSADYRFQSRPFDLVSTTTTCENCAAGCELRVDHRHYSVRRRLAGADPEVNEEWNCDKGRFGYRSAQDGRRLTTPLVRRDGRLEPASWHEAIDAAVTGLKAAGQAVGVLPGGHLTLENAYAWSRFARAVLGTDDIDFRSRPSSDEEAGFLAAHVAGRGLGESVTYADLEKARRVVLVSFEPEDESPIVFLRLRKAWRKRGLEVVTLAPFSTRGSRKMGARLLPTAPGQEAARLTQLGADGGLDEDTIILVGERAATSPGALSAVVAQATTHGARFAWIPRRAGELAALEAGALPGLLPGGRPGTDPAARAEMAAAWGVRSLPDATGRDIGRIIEAATSGELKALVTGGIQEADLDDPRAFEDALDGVGFVLSLEQRPSDVTERADVVLPVALLEEQAGTFINWEHRTRPVALINAANQAPMTDVRVLAALADALGADLGMRSPAQAGADLAGLPDWAGARAGFEPQAPEAGPDGDGRGMLLASWRLLMDNSAALDGADFARAATQPLSVALSPADAEALGIAAGAPVSLSGPDGSMQLPARIEPDMMPGVVWAPLNSVEPLSVLLGAGPADRVQVEAARIAPPAQTVDQGGAA
ncbi:Respiratory-chain NADH dehydrogenase 75 Kd subunit signature 2 [Propionibacterium ruminifibrarum]|uniref:Respiratory-chain NADH dehydrogenase 75 Kd subunit signature 2 n=1 Tax=Propionibacterium ruminifibrarum TaxID=1962131 RepID=A0A375I445_9ACTN|nr:NADH-quinone oxidoreductase subunit G [Propionibacterium ruminifibrarum]SPF68818.1 Respiratory-chain NADH dehydrogenase 75 Kd subunit signature 2 [Propionibacterium ruminifibrarum]